MDAQEYKNYYIQADGILHLNWVGRLSRRILKVKIRYPLGNDPEGLLEKTQIPTDVVRKN